MRSLAWLPQMEGSLLASGGSDGTVRYPPPPPQTPLSSSSTCSLPVRGLGAEQRLVFCYLLLFNKISEGYLTVPSLPPQPPCSTPKLFQLSPLPSLIFEGPGCRGNASWLGQLRPARQPAFMAFPSQTASRSFTHTLPGPPLPIRLVCEGCKQHPQGISAWQRGL